MRTRPLPVTQHRPSTRRRGHDRHLHAVGAPEPPATGLALAPEARVREAGGPQDRASYSCSCGLVFRAAVSTSVGCPHCGAGQAW